MKSYNINLETVFPEYYYKSSLLDIPTLKVHVRNFYNSFVRAFPKMRTQEVSTRNGKSISLTKVEERVMMRRDFYESRYTNLFWIRLYTYIRAKETNRDWDQYKFDHVVQRASDFFVYSGERTALKFINKEVRRAPGEYLQVDEYRRGNFKFKRKRE